MSYDKAKDDERRAAEAKLDRMARAPIHGAGRPGAMGLMLMAGAIAAAAASSVGIVASPTGRTARRSGLFGAPYGPTPLTDKQRELLQSIDYSDVEARVLANMTAAEIRQKLDGTYEPVDKPRKKFRHNRRG